MGSAAIGSVVEFGYLSSRRSFREMVELAHAAYDGPPRSTATDEEIWRAFPRGYVGAWLDGRLCGAIQLWPLDGRRAGDFLIGARRERELTADDLAAVCNSRHTVWFFSGMLVDPAWRGRGLAAHLFAEAMVRWYRDLPWLPPMAFVSLATSEDVRGFIRGFGMEPIRPGDETADGYPLFGRVLSSEQQMFEIVRSARAAAERKGRLTSPPGA